jgi:hypothetical protein
MFRAKPLFATLALAGASLWFSVPSLAADPAATPGIDKRLDNQERRIQRGEKTGQLTEREAGRLERRQDKIQGDLDTAKADGAVTRNERAKLHRELNRSSAAIAREKHDRQHDYNRDGKVDRPRRK